MRAAICSATTEPAADTRKPTDHPLDARSGLQSAPSAPAKTPRVAAAVLYLLKLRFAPTRHLILALLSFGWPTGLSKRIGVMRVGLAYANRVIDLGSNSPGPSSEGSRQPALNHTARSIKSRRPCFRCLHTHSTLHCQFYFYLLDSILLTTERTELNSGSGEVAFSGAACSSRWSIGLDVSNSPKKLKA